MKEAAQTLSWVTTAALGKPASKNGRNNRRQASRLAPPGGRWWNYRTVRALWTCGAGGVDVQSGAPDVGVGSQVPGQRLIRGLRYVAGQRVDALDGAGVRQQVHADPLLLQRGQDLGHRIQQLCKHRLEPRSHWKLPFSAIFLSFHSLLKAALSW